MGTSINKKPFASKLLIFLQIFLGIGAVFGGLALVIDPSGKLIQMPISMLEYSPFHNFLIPGLILLVVLGIAPLIIAYALITRRNWKAADRLNVFPEMHWSWAYSLYIGFALIIWITLEVYFIRSMIWVHLFYVFLGLIIQWVTVLPLVQRYYRVDRQIELTVQGKETIANRD